MSTVEDEDRVFRVYNRKSQEHRAIKGVTRLVKHLGVDRKQVSKDRIQSWQVRHFDVLESGIPWALSDVRV